MIDLQKELQESKKKWCICTLCGHATTTTKEMTEHFKNEHGLKKKMMELKKK